MYGSYSLSNTTAFCPFDPSSVSCICLKPLQSWPEDRLESGSDGRFPYLNATEHLAQRILLTPGFLALMWLL